MTTKLKNFFNVAKEKLKKIYNKIVESLLIAKNRKRNLIVLGLLILLNLFLITSYYSYAYYNNYSSFVLIHSKVGNPMANDADYSLQIFLENQNNKGSYLLGEAIPLVGYTYSGYQCTNNGTLIYDDNLKTTYIELKNKDACSIYFNVNQDSDITSILKTESAYNSGSYINSSVIPPYGYDYNKIECENGSTGTFNAEKHYIELSSTNRDICTIYFNKKNTNNTVKLFLENAYQSGNYINKESFIPDVTYTLNTTKSVCKNNNGEKVNTTIEYINGEIKITGDSLTCEIYMDRKND